MTDCRDYFLQIGMACYMEEIIRVHTTQLVILKGSLCTGYWIEEDTPSRGTTCVVHSLIDVTNVDGHTDSLYPDDIPFVIDKRWVPTKISENHLR
jgi:hypothetical protein